MKIARYKKCLKKRNTNLNGVFELAREEQSFFKFPLAINRLVANRLVFMSDIIYFRVIEALKLLGSSFG